MFTKIISGGQTGADQAGLDVAIKHDIPHGGWIPRGRMTEDGPLPDKYHLQEMPTKSYPKRTEQNILDSDGTLIISRGKLTGGSGLTAKLAKQHGKPWLHLDLDKMSVYEARNALVDWAQVNGVKVLNVAGPRATKDSQIYGVTFEILEAGLNVVPAKSVTS
jgi:hypothetical protein